MDPHREVERIPTTWDPEAHTALPQVVPFRHTYLPLDLRYCDGRQPRTLEVSPIGGATTASGKRDTKKVRE